MSLHVLGQGRSSAKSPQLKWFDWLRQGRKDNNALLLMAADVECIPSEAYASTEVCHYTLLGPVPESETVASRVLPGTKKRRQISAQVGL